MVMASMLIPAREVATLTDAQTRSVELKASGIDSISLAISASKTLVDKR
jgi:hypothetical protein